MPLFPTGKNISIFTNVSVNNLNSKRSQIRFSGLACGVSVKTRHPFNCERISKSEQSNPFIFACKYLRNHFHFFTLKFVPLLLMYILIENLKTENVEIVSNFTS